MELPEKCELRLQDLCKGLPAITPVFGATLAEAGSVCFKDQQHQNGVELKVSGTFTATYNVYWKRVTKQMLRCWNDPEVATEHAAYGVAFLIIKDLTEYTVIERSYKGTGFDYWVGYDSDEELIFQEKARLEVSGIRNGNTTQINSRVKQKVEQVAPSDDSGLPAFIVVVEFGTPLSKVVRK